jgi:hypothetical protein
MPARGGEPSSEEILARALAYPFPRPRTSVAIAGDRVLELLALDPDDLGLSRVRADGAEGTLADACRDAGLPVDALLGRRSPVLAYGSNASPASLRWKFPAERDGVVPLIRGTMRDVDVVYSSHIAVYGSVPATLQVSPGTEAETFLALLTEGQFELVAGWEINARHETLELELALDTGEAPAAVAAFLSRHGCLTADGEEIAVAEVPARDRRHGAMTQPEVLEHVRAIVAPELPLEELVAGAVRDHSRARAYTAELRRTARPFAGSRRGDSNP